MEMDRVILIKYGELSTKKANRNFFINTLYNNVRNKLSKYDVKISKDRARMYIEFKDSELEDIKKIIDKIFGIHMYHIAYIVDTNSSDICNKTLEILKEMNFSTFKVETKRSYKSFPQDSMEFSRNLGGFILKNIKNIKFGSITLFCGSNGCGKSTLLNLISSKLNSVKKTNYDKGTLFKNYMDVMRYEMNKVPEEIVTITSDDIFDYLLDLRSINSHVNRRKDELARYYLDNKYNSKDISIFDYDEIRKNYETKTATMSKFIRGNLMNNTISSQSNGAPYFPSNLNEIKENGIYILPITALED